MKARDTGLTFALGLLLLFSVPIGLAQQPEASDSGKWMLEITQANQAPNYLQLEDGPYEAQSGFNDLDWQPEWNRADKTIPQASGLEFKYRMQGTTVTVRVLLTFDSPASPPGSVEELPIGNYEIHPGESIAVAHLSRFGLQPVQVKVVTAKPPHATQPEIVNKTSSMLAEKVDQDRAEYKLFLRNTSELAVNAVMISVLDGNGRCKVHNQSAFTGWFISPDSTRELHLSLPVPDKDEGVLGADGESCSDTTHGFPASPQSINSSAMGAPEIVIEAVDFEDGTYEGDDQKAALLEGGRLGREIERARITTMVEKQIASTQPDGIDKLASVQSQASALPNNADPAALESIMARFPTVPDSAKEAIKQAIQDGLAMEKGIFLGNLRLYQFELAKQLASEPSLQHWWDTTKGRCDWLARPGSCGKE